jgi:PAS domain S-box-containing protein
MKKPTDPPESAALNPPGPGPTDPDRDGTTPPDPPFPAEVPRPHASETAEREVALRRGRRRRLQPGEDDGSATRKALWASNPAFAALADNVRDYAVFLMDRDGVITFWGEGAHLMKWWTSEEAEGSHLRLLYPEGGAEDGTAEEHLRQAEEEGEYDGEGCRVRRDASTFWAGITLTALRDPDGHLFGFAKTTRNLTARRAAEDAVASANAAQSARDLALEHSRNAKAAQERAEEAAEFAQEQARSAHQYITQVLEPELMAERAKSSALQNDLDTRAAERKPRDSGDE